MARPGSPLTIYVAEFPLFFIFVLSSLEALQRRVAKSIVGRWKIENGCFETGKLSNVNTIKT